MAAAPDYKIYDADGTYQAAVKELEAGAALVAFYGDGAELRYDHSFVLWKEGAEIQAAAESYDVVAETALRRRELVSKAFEAQRQTAHVRGVRVPAKRIFDELVSLDRAGAVGAGIQEAGL